jgi:hypothetical protein
VDTAINGIAAILRAVVSVIALQDAGPPAGTQVTHISGRTLVDVVAVVSIEREDAAVRRVTTVISARVVVFTLHRQARGAGASSATVVLGTDVPVRTVAVDRSVVASRLGQTTVLGTCICVITREGSNPDAVSTVTGVSRGALVAIVAVLCVVRVAASGGGSTTVVGAGVLIVAGECVT